MLQKSRGEIPLLFDRFFVSISISILEDLIFFLESHNVLFRINLFIDIG
jgi:hypothetical protein